MNKNKWGISMAGVERVGRIKGITDRLNYYTGREVIAGNDGYWIVAKLVFSNWKSNSKWALEIYGEEGYKYFHIEISQILLIGTGIDDGLVRIVLRRA